MAKDRKHLAVVSAAEPQPVRPERQALVEAIARRETIKSEILVLERAIEAQMERSIEASALVDKLRRDLDEKRQRRADILVEAALAGNINVTGKIREVEAALETALADRALITEAREALEAAKTTRRGDLEVREIAVESAARDAIAADPAIQAVVAAYRAATLKYLQLKAAVDTLRGNRVLSVEEASATSPDVRMAVGDYAARWLDSIAKARVDANFELPQI